MPGKLDEISQSIGALQGRFDGFDKGLDEIKNSIRENRDLQSRRHGENRRDIEGLQREVGTLTRTIALMQPQLTSLQISRNKLMLLAGVGLVVLFIVGRLVEGALLAAGGWIVQHMR